MPSEPRPPSPAHNATVQSLDNGLEIIVQEDHAHPLVSVQLWVRAGSLHEESWTGAGLAHLTEHMMFKGTFHAHGPAAVAEHPGAGGYVNAYTSFNRTVYWIDGVSDKTEGYVDILADMAMRSKFDAEELGREKDVIRREMASGSGRSQQRRPASDAGHGFPRASAAASDHRASGGV